MPPNPFLKAGILMLFLVVAFITSWELYLRHQGNTISYDDGGSLWSNKRKQVYVPIDKATVFIGSSRIKYDLDIPTWQSITGNHAIQLANVGSNPCPLLTDLAGDPNFKGKLIIDVTEGLFFSTSPRPNATPLENLAYYKKETPAQKFGFLINHALESTFVFLDRDFCSLNSLIAEHAHLPNRPGVMELPTCPAGFTTVSFDRQSKMNDVFLRDTAQQNKVKGIWALYGRLAGSDTLTTGAIDSIIAVVKQDCDKIKARGGQILFVRTPCSGPLLMGENIAFPREKFWNKLLQQTGIPGIHFADYPEIAHFQCPEFSHLSPQQAASFTKVFIRILQEKGWQFSGSGNYKTITSTL